jgi:curli biogenesis system outer membrane secretion channel CsgG
MNIKWLVLIILFLTMPGCKKDEKVVDAETPPQSSARANVDFGGVEHVSITAKGYGKTLSQAVDDALKRGIEQVNGKRVHASTDSVNLTYDISVGGDSVEIEESALTEMVSSKTDGAVTEFKIISQKQITRPVQTSKTEYSFSDEGGESSYSSSGNSSASAASAAASASASASGSSSASVSRGAVKESFKNSSTRNETVWEVEVTAKVAKYRESADAKRPRIVIAPARISQSTFIVGSSRYNGEELGQLVAGRLSDAITQTSRFTVLDRQYTDEISKEMDFIQSGMVKNEDYARVGQMLATDLIVMPRIERFEYLRSSRKMRMVDREIVSYSGGGTISVKVINAVTGQVVLSESYSAELPSTPPTTMSKGIDGGKLMSILMDSITDELVRTMLMKTFPISVVSMSGTDVVLNQGGQGVKLGASYSAVRLGQDIIDPQTGQSLGKMDSPCCTIEVTRIGPNLSYGRILDENFRFSGEFKPGMIELREIVAGKKSSTQNTAAQSAGASSQNKKSASKSQTRPTAPAPAAQPDDDW